VGVGSYEDAVGCEVAEVAGFIGGGCGAMPGVENGIDGLSGGLLEGGEGKAEDSRSIA